MLGHAYLPKGAIASENQRAMEESDLDSLINSCKEHF
jgi:hypothetical protein